MSNITFGELVVTGQWVTITVLTLIALAIGFGIVFAHKYFSNKKESEQNTRL